MVNPVVQKLARIARRTRSYMPYLDRAGENSVLISGSGRSGTTWLAECAAHEHRCRLIFEPFKIGSSGLSNSFGYRTYIAADETDTRYGASIRRVLHGGVRCQWTDRYNSSFVYDRRIVKAIRSNLMQGWIAKHVPEVCIAFVIRDPFAVTLSQSRGEWPLDLKKLTAQPSLYTQWLHPFDQILNLAKPGFQSNFAHWCIENYVPLAQFRALDDETKKRVRVFQYDTLRDNEGALAEFLDFCGTPNIAAAIERSKTPSRVSRGKTTFGAKNAAVDVSEADQIFAQNCLQEFGLTDWVI